MIDTLIYCFGRVLIGLVQMLPLPLVARLGSAGGALAFHLDARHRQVALNNLMMCFGSEKSAEETRELARENFRRIGENYACAIKTAGMTADELKAHVEFINLEDFPRKNGDMPLPNIVVAIGHFGNFELYARIHDVRPEYQVASTYRALKQPALNRLMQELRNNGCCRYFERRTEGGKLRELMSHGGNILGLLADQSSRGVRAPFFGHDCHTGLAPAVLALRYQAVLLPGICYRVAPAKWCIELGEKIATHENGEPRTSEAIMRDVNRALETAVRLDPANWFWVHRRWKD
jgi:KDO2-lipid IV(A) lauroyltransferase